MRHESTLFEQMELRLVSNTFALTKAQAACLGARTFLCNRKEFCAADALHIG